MAQEEEPPLQRGLARVGRVKDNIQQIDASRPYAQQAIQTAILTDMAGFMEDVMMTLKEQIPEGAYTPFTFTVSGTTPLDLNPLVAVQGRYLGLPWMAFDIFNDGPSQVYMTVNRKYTDSQTPLYPREHIRIEMKTRQIGEVMLSCVSCANDPTPSATVRIFAVR
jgi:hypothetical protein